MDYPLENLTPEKFQQLCQALVGRDNTGLRAFPVAQPDGGRDALVYPPGGNGKSFVIFQVKFVREPERTVDPHKWLLRILEEELPKIQAQIPKGAREYVLVTNVRGTAHPEAGSIDRAQQLFAELLSIPGKCWWRDDINRRLDSAWDLKWIYPEIMTGPDLIRSIVESGLAEHQSRRSSAIRAFLTEQFELDRQVKFKQVELQNDLLDLFIDVPIGEPRSSGSRRSQHQLMSLRWLTGMEAGSGAGTAQVSADQEVLIYEPEPGYYARQGIPPIGAATFLLRDRVQRELPRMVLEGAPGQGKSTITQYVCQVHRMRVLNRTSELAQLPEGHRAAPARLPFKVDLRDFSEWLAKRNPFSADLTESVPPDWKKSLESFLAALVRHHSGGADFDIGDLLAVAQRSAVLLVMDGLDEVADIERRKDVVDEIVRGVNRLGENALSLQVMVTTRPAAFANSPGLPDDRFPYFQLESVTRPLIDAYTEKWLRAKKLPPQEGADVRRILNEKLDQPHLRDLARNPMQLAILLSLIHTRGASLPDKRTALYDSYMDLFFDREAEKSATVRKHRDLLINIHRYLAWILHSESEQGSTRGSIAEERLQDLLRDYLEKEGHDPQLATVLFAGMVERVVALVSRVQGTYEFEVQPLREYFAARYLYETAPYSPPGNERRGTKPDRFDAIARNFFWLNVTRFYAGCYSKGELASLIDRLTELTNEKGYKLISHPRVLAATLLSDWVFTQHPRSVKQVVNLVLDGLGLRYVLVSTSRRVGNSVELVLPEDSGKTELLDRCFLLLREEHPRDFALDVVDLVRANGRPSELVDRWLWEVEHFKAARISEWLEYGLQLGVLGSLDRDRLEKVLEGVELSVWQAGLFYRGRRFDLLHSKRELFAKASNAILGGSVAMDHGRSPQSPLDLLAQTVDGRRYARSFASPSGAPLRAYWENDRVWGLLAPESVEPQPYPESTQAIELARVALAQSDQPTSVWVGELRPWDELVEAGRRLWGERWAWIRLANLACGIRSTTEKYPDYADLFDHSQSLCRRARYARLRAGQLGWWRKAIGQEPKGYDALLLSILLWTWGSGNTLMSLASDADAVVSNLEPVHWWRLDTTLRRGRYEMREFAGVRSSDLDVDPRALPSKLDPRTAVLFAHRTSDELRPTVYEKYLRNYTGSDSHVLTFCESIAIDIVATERGDWNSALRSIRENYARGATSRRFAYQNLSRRLSENPMPLKEAQAVAAQADRYPGYIVALAEQVCRTEVARSVTPVGAIAVRERWFD
jgi:hypothetical protein